MSTTTLITGNTYPVKDAIRALGGRWDAAAKGWRVPAERAADAQALVSGAPSGYVRAAGASSRPRFSCCRTCRRQPSKRNPLYRSGECRECWRESHVSDHPWGDDL